MLLALFACGRLSIDIDLLVLVLLLLFVLLPSFWLVMLALTTANAETKAWFVLALVPVAASWVRRAWARGFALARFVVAARAEVKSLAGADGLFEVLFVWLELLLLLALLRG